MPVYSSAFSEYTTGVQPSDWTARWDAGATYVTTDVVGATGGKVLRMTTTASTRNAVSWDDKNSVDFDVTVRVKTTDTTGAFYVVLRGSGDGSTETGYLAQIVGSGGNRTLGFASYKNAVGASLVTAINVNTQIPATNADYYVRFNLTGADLKAKVWAFGESEPGSWMLEVTDGSSPITGSGWAGFFVNHTAPVDIDTIALTSSAVQTDVAGTAVGDTAEFAMLAAPAAAIAIDTTSGDDVSSIALTVEPSIYVAATAGDDTSDILLDNWLQVLIDAQAVGDTSAVELFYTEKAEFAVDVPELESVFEGVENTFFNFQVSFPIAVSFTGEDLQIATFSVDLPMFAAEFTSPFGETLNIVLPMLESAFTETDQGYADFSAVLPMLFSEFSGGVLLLESFEVVCVNARSKAHSTYTNFPFNSFARFNGVDLGCSSAGIHTLGGDLDETENIDAELWFGLSDCGTSNKKRVDSVWLRVRRNGALDVKLKYDEVVEVIDRVPNYSTSDGVQTVRSKGARGAEGNFIQVGVANVDGSDFELPDMEMDTVTLSGR